MAGGRFEDFLGLFSREADESDRHGLVVAMLTESEPVRQLMAANQLEPVVRWVGAEPQLEVRRELLNRLMYPGAAEQVLAKARLHAEVVAWIKAEPDPSHRSSAVQTTLYNPQVWQAILSGGRPELLDELVALESDPEARREVWRYMLAAPSGLVAYHVERGEHPQALQLLEKNADHDLGRLHLATYLLATGQIEPRMAEVRRRLEQAPQASDARLLVYLARARGDLPAARRAAEQADDPGLLQAVLVEQHAWAEAAALQAAGPCPLPIPTREQSIPKAGRRRRAVESAGRLSAAGRCRAGFRADRGAIERVGRREPPRSGGSVAVRRGADSERTLGRRARPGSRRPSAAGLRSALRPSPIPRGAGTGRLEVRHRSEPRVARSVANHQGGLSGAARASVHVGFAQSRPCCIGWVIARPQSRSWRC